MKLIRSTLLAVSLSVSACYAQAPVPAVPEVRGFDVASCLSKDFIAAHVEIDKDTLKVLKVVPGPGNVIILDQPVVYKLTKADKDGKHYVSGDFEIVVEDIDKDGFLSGYLYLKGAKVAVFYGMESDGSDVKLMENATKEHQACVDVRKEDSSKPAESTLPTDSGESKI